MSFQPVLPIPLGEGVNFFVRPLLPVILRQPVPSPGGSGFEDKGVDLGDISFDAAIGKTLSSGVILVGGVVGTLPTATDDALGTGQWLLGPEFLAGILGKAGFLGVLVNHQWNVAGDDDFNTSITGGQYFYTINLKDGWQIQAAPTYSYNHEATSGSRWTVPVAVGLKKTTILGGSPWKFGVEYWHYVAQADFSRQTFYKDPDHTVTSFSYPQFRVYLTWSVS